MASEQNEFVLRSIQMLFGVGATGGLTDAQLLERFLSRREQSAEAAFEALVLRHGPMVLDVCRNVLHDPHDAQDAFQATFLILTRKAKSIRRRDALASWLFGVARRVAAKAKTDATRRRVHERRVAVMTATEYDRSEGPQDLSVLYEEINRLPEKYREPIVLCYLGGMTYEAAAQHLRCPIGTVSVRLKRARERLRSRLTRRGVSVPAGLVIAGLTPKAASAALPAALVGSTVRVALRSSAGEAVVAGAISTTVVTLTQGVLKSMFLTKLKIIGLCVVSLCLVAVGTGTLVGQQESADKAKAEAPPTQGAPSPERREDPDMDFRTHLVETARRRWEAQRKFYEEGRITIDRFLDALAQLMHAEVQAATTRDAKIAAVESYLERVKEVEVREQAELEVGRGTTADLAEAVFRREQAEMELRLARMRSEPVDLESLDRRLRAVERKLGIE